jgi:hypothetical protein
MVTSCRPAVRWVTVVSLLLVIGLPLTSVDALVSRRAWTWHQLSWAWLRGGLRLCLRCVHRQVGAGGLPAAPG